MNLDLRPCYNIGQNHASQNKQCISTILLNDQLIAVIYDIKETQYFLVLSSFPIFSFYRIQGLKENGLPVALCVYVFIQFIELQNVFLSLGVQSFHLWFSRYLSIFHSRVSTSITFNISSTFTTHFCIFKKSLYVAMSNILPFYYSTLMECFYLPFLNIKINKFYRNLTRSSEILILNENVYFSQDLPHKKTLTPISTLYFS